MAPVLQLVALEDIALDDETCMVTYRPQMAVLQRSVAQVGVLTPVHLRQVEGARRLQIVCGAKRLRACQQAGQARLPALVYTAAELSDEAALLLMLHDNIGCRELNAVEKGRVLRRLRDVLQDDVGRLLEVFCPLLELPPRIETLELYGTLVTLDEALQAAVVDGLVPLDIALWMGRQDAPEQQSLLALFTGGMKLGSNRAREFVALIEDICHRDRIGATALLQSLGVPELLDDATFSGPQKIEQVRRRLRTQRYPRLSEHEQCFQHAVRELRLPPQISLQPPPYFDGQQYQVAFRFGSREALQACAQRLLDAASDPALEALLTLL
jgi:ParB family chromosome partitioning protein